MQLLRLSQLAAVAAVAAAQDNSSTSDTASTSLNCREVVIPVDISANNFNLPANLTQADITNDFLTRLGTNPQTPVSGRYNIGARYCEPLVQVGARSTTLQILIHGIASDRNYWSGLAAPGTRPGQDTYSWIVYAAKQGYPTLSIDRLCNGQSSHPDGIAQCQLPLETESVHALITLARGGTLPGPARPRAFSKIVVATHSYGSLLLNRLSQTHPADADALIPTGFSFNLTVGFAGVGTLGGTPAAQADPQRFGNLPPSYLTYTNRTSFERYYWFGAYTQSVVDFAYATRGTVTLGEFASILLGQQPAPNYRNKLFLLNGVEDIVFCSESAMQAATLQPGDCPDGFDQAVGRNYPAASNFAFYNTPRTGHNLNLHLTAPQSYKQAFDYLASNGF